MRLATFAVPLLIIVAITAPAGAQTSRIDDPEATVVKDLVVNANTGGPAWWKVSKGRSVVWVLALPPQNVPINLSWDRSTLRRRMAGSRQLLMPPEARAYFEGNWREPLPDPIPGQVLSGARQVGVPPGRYLPATIPQVFALRDYYYRTERLGFPIDSQITAEADRRRIKVRRPPSMNVTLTDDVLSSSDPEVQACATALLKEVDTDPQRFRTTARHWAQGRVTSVIASPRSAWTYCVNRILPGYSRRAIDAQTRAIAEALQTPGKSVAVAPLRLLVAEDGILQRLKAEGYVITDPAGR